MDMMSVLWQFGVLAAVIIFGIKIGLASGLANLSKKLFAGICIGYGGGVLLCTYIASFFAEQITEAIYSYNTVFYIIMASIMIIAGLFTIREWKVYDKNTTTATCLAVVAPCPCCFGSIIASVLIVAPTIGFGFKKLSIVVAVALMIVMIVTYFASNIIVKLTDKPYPIILGNFMLFLGAYFLLSAIVIPSIAQAMQGQFGGVTMIDSQSLILILVALVALVIVGVVLYKRSDNLLK